MSVKKIILFILLGIFVVSSFYLVYAAGRKIWPFRTKYQVVVLQTGEVYFGKLTLFPTPKMINVWIPQQSQDEKNPGLQVIPLSAMYFSPENVLYLEPSRISWWSNLSEDSQVVKIMEGKTPSQSQSSEQEESETTDQSMSGSTPTSTTK